MRLCVGTAKGIIVLDPERGATPLMVLADPASVWCMAQDCDEPDTLYAGSIHNTQAGSARGKASLARSGDGGRSWQDITPRNARDDEVWALAAAPTSAGRCSSVFRMPGFYGATMVAAVFTNANPS